MYISLSLSLAFFVLGHFLRVTFFSAGTMILNIVFILIAFGAVFPFLAGPVPGRYL